MQVFRCMHKFVQTTNYIDTHKDNNAKFCIILFHEMFKILCQVMDKVLVNMEMLDPIWGRCIASSRNVNTKWLIAL